MNVTATEVKNRLGQVLEQAQSKPVFIEKAGRRHSVVMSVGHYEALLKASRPEQPVTDSSALIDVLRTRLTMPLSRVGIDAVGMPRRLAPQFMVKGERLALHPQAGHRCPLAARPGGISCDLRG